MKVYGDVISPFVRMCLVTAHEVGLKDKVQLEKTSAKLAEANLDLQKLSPIAKIPVLVTDHGHAVYDSRVIMEYLAHVAGHAGLIPDDGVKRFRILTLMATAQGAADAAVALRYETAQRPEPMQWPAYVERQKSRIAATLDDLNGNWQDTFDTVTVGTISLGCMLGYLDFRHGTMNWRQGRPALASFHQTFAARDSMKAWPLV